MQSVKRFFFNFIYYLKRLECHVDWLFVVIGNIFINDYFWNDFINCKYFFIDKLSCAKNIQISVHVSNQLCGYTEKDMAQRAKKLKKNYRISYIFD